ncbi:MAG TPA: hypothetical protein VJV78_41940 [Polyangiales bacterium]|nr:hypothetical protein [Polyangiales bacterium]
MAKMAVSIVVLALGLYAAQFVTLGDYTLKEHVTRIAQTSEVKELGEGIATAVGSAKTVVKSKLAERLHATRWDPDPDSRPSDE